MEANWLILRRISTLQWSYASAIGGLKMSFFRLTQNAMHAIIMITVKIILFFQVHETSRFPSICCVYLVLSTYNDPKRFLMSQQHVNESFSRYPTLLRSMFCVCKVNSFNMAERRFFHRLFTCEICIYWHVNYNCLPVVVGKQL